MITLQASPPATQAFDQAPAATDGRGLIDRCTMSLTEILLLAMGVLIFAAALSLAIGIASRLITVA
jgi:hypothetical protein